MPRTVEVIHEPAFAGGGASGRSGGQCAVWHTHSGRTTWTVPLSWDDYYPIFDAALDLPAEARAPFLDDACEGRPDIRAKVESLLAASDDTTARSAEAVSDWVSALLGPDIPRFELTGARVGPFVLKDEIGRGGMGVVYLAERAEGGFEQTVAVKVVASILHSPDALSRFKSEQRILARLEHPGIARLVDGGLSDEGVPYLAMEYVAGTSISRYCEEKNPHRFRTTRPLRGRVRRRSVRAREPRRASGSEAGKHPRHRVG